MRTTFTDKPAKDDVPAGDELRDEFDTFCTTTLALLVCAVGAGCIDGLNISPAPAPVDDVIGGTSTILFLLLNNTIFRSSSSFATSFGTCEEVEAAVGELRGSPIGKLVAAGAGDG